MIAEDSVFHRNMLYNVFFLNTSNLHSSIYNWAKILEEPIYLSQPAKLQAALTINLSEITTNTFKIKKETKFNIDDFKYLLPHSITINQNNGSVSAFYNQDTLETNYLDTEIRSPYLKIKVITNEDGSRSLILLINLYQIESNIFKFKVLSNDIIDRSIYDVSFNGNLAYFNVNYLEPNSTTNIALKTLFNDIEDSKEEKYIYYSPINESAIRLYFSTKPGFFKPKFNSQLTAEVFTTLGETANFKYTGNIGVDTNSLGLTTANVVALTDSIGGTSSNSLQDTKLKLIKKLRTRNSITTSYDLESLFESLRSSNTTNSFLTAIKTRDDFISRQFSVFSLLKDDNNAIIPSNTIDLDLSIMDIENLNYSFKPGTLVLYDRVMNKYRLLDNEEIPDYYLTNNDSYLYCIPFLINLDFKEFPKTNYYSTNYDKSYNLYYDYIDTSSVYDVVLNDFTISRNSLINVGTFNLSCYLNSSMPDTIKKIKLKVFKDGLEQGYVFLTKVNNSTEFYCNFNTEDSFDSNGNYKILNTFKDMDCILIPEFIFSENIEFKLAVGYGNTLLDTDFTEIALLNPKTYIELAEDISDVIRSKLTINDSTGIVSIKSIPVISSLFFLNSKLNSNTSRTFNNLITLLRNSISLLENNTSLDLKLFNTYGLSRNTTADTIDLSLSIQIKLNIPKPDPILEYNIKEFITKFIEKSNNATAKEFALSNMLKELENTFKEISYIRFVNINGANLQNVGFINNYTDNNYPKNYIPEFMTVKKINGANFKNNDYIYNINIQYI